MTKRVNIVTLPHVRINERGFEMLLELDRRSGKGLGGAVVGNVELAESLGCCLATARRALRALQREQLIEVFERHQLNGGQAENEYRITPLGRKVLGGDVR